MSAIRPSLCVVQACSKALNSATNSAIRRVRLPRPSHGIWSRSDVATAVKSRYDRSVNWSTIAPIKIARADVVRPRCADFYAPTVQLGDSIVCVIPGVFSSSRTGDSPGHQLRFRCMWSPRPRTLLENRCMRLPSGGSGWRTISPSCRDQIVLVSPCISV